MCEVEAFRHITFRVLHRKTRRSVFSAQKTGKRVTEFPLLRPRPIEFSMAKHSARNVSVVVWLYDENAQHSRNCRAWHTTKVKTRRLRSSRPITAHCVILPGWLVWVQSRNVLLFSSLLLCLFSLLSPRALHLKPRGASLLRVHNFVEIFTVK